MTIWIYEAFLYMSPEKVCTLPNILLFPSVFRGASSALETLVMLENRFWSKQFQKPHRFITILQAI